MYCDSKAAIAISCNPIQHSRTKHIDVRYHFIKEKVEKGIVELFFVRTEYQLADLFTNALPEERFKYLIRRLDGNPARANVKQALGRPYALSWKPCQGDSLNQPDHRFIDITYIATTAKIITEVVTAASTTITATDILIPAATTAAAPALTATPSKRTNGVVIRDPKESTTTTTSTIIHSEAKSKDKYKGILMDYFKGMSYDDIHPIFEKLFDPNVAFLQKTKEQINEEESRALKRINETLAEKAAKRQKLEELKRHLQIVPNEDDDVYIEATPLARKKCSWSRKSQELEAVGILWCADNNIYNNTVDFASRKEIPTDKKAGKKACLSFEITVDVLGDCPDLSLDHRFGMFKAYDGNHALLANFMEKFLRTVRFGNNDFAVIVGYGDVVIGSMTIKKVYYVEAKASSSQSWLWHQRLSHLNFTTINNLVRNNLVRGLPKMKFEKDHLCSACEQVSQVTKTSKKDLEELFHNFYDDYFDASTIKKSPTMNVEISLNEGEVFHESISNDMISNVNEASTSYNVFNNRLEDAYFDESTTFHDNSDVHTFYQPYPHETKWTKDHPLHKIIALGYCQQEGIDYDETFAPVARIQAIRLFFTYAAHKDFTFFQMDVKTSFLNGILKEKAYVAQPPGFFNKQYPDHVYALNKALYGLKQAPRKSYDVLLKLLIDSGFQKEADHVGCHLDRKSTSGSVQFLGDKLVCWSSKNQNYVSISIAESEYVAVSGCCAQVLWMRTQLIDYGFFYDKVPIYCDSKSAIAIS
nr:copia protein [Tanacetum cinerariifolium]